MKKFRIGIVGCGAISSAYFNHAPNFKILEVAACADLDVARAKATAEKFNVPKACTVKELMADDSIDAVVNLTIPAAHVEVALMAVEAGKHTHCEKPLGVNRKQAEPLLKKAEEKGVRVGCAPDTFFGAGHQTARKAIDDGMIGRPVAATAYMLSRGVEGWHPNPEFYYKPGGGPMFDMGPYYLTQLINLFGQIKRISGFASIAIPERTIGSEPFKGKVIKVETPDHVAGTIEFANGVICTIITSFAVMAGQMPSPITVFGTEGTLYNPDPNGFDGDVKIFRAGAKEWETLPHTHKKGHGRIVGVADMAHAVQSGRPHRASGELTFGVLDAMEGFLDASRENKVHEVTAKYDRPAALPTELAEGMLDD